MTRCKAIDLSKYFIANLEDGELFWKKRTPDMFKNGKQSAAHSCGVWNAKYAGKPALASVDNAGYRRGSFLGSYAKQHRVLLAMRNGVWPDITDHINGDRLDNSGKNLRDVTSKENSRNISAQTGTASGHMGVKPYPNGWRATICNTHLGVFKCVTGAIICRSLAEKRLGFHENHGRH